MKWTRLACHAGDPHERIAASERKQSFSQTRNEAYDAPRRLRQSEQSPNVIFYRDHFFSPP